MNENVVTNNVNRFKICRCCLETNIDVNPMSYEHENLYRNFLETAITNEYNMYVCIHCNWYLRKLDKFKKQCQTVNQILKDSFFMKTHPNHTLKNFNNTLNLNKSKISVISIQSSEKNDISNDSFIIYDNNHIINDNNGINYDNNGINYDNNHITIDIKSDLNDRTDDFNDDFVIGLNGDDDDDEKPLHLLSKDNMKRYKKKNKRKRKRSSSKDTKETKNRNGTKVKRKKEKRDLPEGFSSRMVQETDEYVVIKLTKEQVIKEMEDKSKTELYQRYPYKCEKCVKGFNFEEVLRNHMEKHSQENGNFVCEMCTQRCPSVVSLRGHIKSHTTRYKCKICAEIRLSRQHLLEHYCNTHSGQAITYKCDTCPFTTNKRTVMQRHVRCHNASERHACDKCGKLFNTIDSLRVHTMRHDKSVQYQCKLCANSFVYQSLLERHAARVHHNNDYYCVECDVRFKTHDSLRLHFKNAKMHRDTTNNMSDNSRNISMDCSNCLRNNCEIHSNKNGGNCPHCDASFSRKSTLKQHLLLHDKVRPFVCHCGAAYVQRNALNRHMHDKHGDGKLQENIQGNIVTTN